MTDLQNILLILLIVCGCVLIGYLIFALKRVVLTLNILQHEIKDLKQEIVPAVQNISLLSEQARATLQDFETHREDLGVAIANIKRFSDNVVRIQKIVTDKIEPPLQEVGSTLSGILKGYNAFITSWKRYRS